MGLDLDALDLKTLLRQEALPDTTVQTIGDDKIGGDPDGAGDHVCQRRRLPGPANPPKLALHIDDFDGAVGGDDTQGRRVGRQLVVRVAEIRIFLVVDLYHGFELPLYLGLDIRVDVGLVPVDVFNGFRPRLRPNAQSKEFCRDIEDRHANKKLFLKRLRSYLPPLP